MPIYELTKDELRKIEETSFSKAKIRERGDLQRLLRNQIEIISPDTLIIAEEFGEWDDSKRRIDLLGVDKNANLVVFELRSEERRVGKECRSRWSTDHYIENTIK